MQGKLPAISGDASQTQLPSRNWWVSMREVMTVISSSVMVQSALSHQYHWKFGCLHHLLRLSVTGEPLAFGALGHTAQKPSCSEQQLAPRREPARAGMAWGAQLGGWKCGSPGQGARTAQSVGSQRGCGCPITGSVQGQVGVGFEQPDLVKYVPAHGRGLF